MSNVHSKTVLCNTYNRTELEATENLNAERIAIEQAERFEAKSIAQQIHQFARVDVRKAFGGDQNGVVQQMKAGIDEFREDRVFLDQQRISGVRYQAAQVDQRIGYKAALEKIIMIMLKKRRIKRIKTKPKPF